MTDKTQNLIGIDAAPLMRKALQELRTLYKTERLKAERDKPEKELVLEVPCMAFETYDGQWRLETIGRFVECQDGDIKVTERTERLAEAELRYQLMHYLVSWRWCNPNDARKFAARAKINIHARVPYQRIVSK